MIDTNVTHGQDSVDKDAHYLGPSGEDNASTCFEGSELEGLQGSLTHMKS